MRPQAPYADRLRLCTRLRGDQPSCPLRYLPLISMRTAHPDVDDLIGRTAVSHRWMGQRLAEVLEALPAELRQLSGSLTAIVVAGDVRPSFYWRRTGAIYLDPASLWLSNAEKADIDPAPDFRSAFGLDLGFRMLSRYVAGNDYAWRGYSLDDDSERTLEEILLPMARLLYHELAHANDFLPPAAVAGINPALTVEEAALALADRQISRQLEAASPLNSALMSSLAGVMFGGERASADELALTPAAVGAEFAADQANDDYAYFSRHEDLAMLFEELMMRRRFGVQRDIAVTSAPPSEDPDANDYIVAWGQRGRLGDAAVRERARLLAALLLPGEDFAPFFANLEPPQALRADVGWVDNLSPQGAAKTTRAVPVQDRLPPDLVRW